MKLEDVLVRLQFQDETLLKIKLRRTKMTDDQLKGFAAGLSASSVREISLSDMLDAKSALAVLEACPSSITEISFSGNELKDEGFVPLVPLLQRFPYLGTVNFSNCGLKDAGILELAKIIPACPNLKWVLVVGSSTNKATDAELKGAIAAPKTVAPAAAQAAVSTPKVTPVAQADLKNVVLATLKGFDHLLDEPTKQETLCDDLFAAINQQRIDLIKKAIAAGANVNYQKGPTLNAALHYAVGTKSEDLVRFFCEAGSNPLSANAGKKTPVDFALMQGEDSDVYSAVCAAAAKWRRVHS